MISLKGAVLVKNDELDGAEAAYLLSLWVSPLAEVCVAWAFCLLFPFTQQAGLCIFLYLLSISSTSCGMDI